MILENYNPQSCIKICIEKIVQQPFCKAWKLFSAEIWKMLECHFWAYVMLRQSRLWASRASPAQASKSRGLRMVLSKNFSRATFLFSGSLSWSIYIWAIYPWNKFDEKAQCDVQLRKNVNRPLIIFQ